MDAGGTPVHRPLLPHLVHCRRTGPQLQSREDRHHVPHERGRDVRDCKAEAAGRQGGAGAVYWGGVGHGGSARVLERDQGLGPYHGLPRRVDAPRDPLRRGGARATERNVGYAGGRVVGPVKGAAQDRQVHARPEGRVVAECVATASSLGENLRQGESQEKRDREEESFEPPHRTCPCSGGSYTRPVGLGNKARQVKGLVDEDVGRDREKNTSEGCLYRREGKLELSTACRMNVLLTYMYVYVYVLYNKV